MGHFSKAFEESNSKLAEACQSCAAQCCKKGLLFLLPSEEKAIRIWLNENDSNKLLEFDSCLTEHQQFFLFDQRDACMFLNSTNMCTLHGAGIKPKECYLWPVHIYLDILGTPEVRISKSCCDGHRHVASDHPIIAEAVMFAADIGYERLLQFRSLYAGSYEHELLCKIDFKIDEGNGEIGDDLASPKPL